MKITAIHASNFLGARAVDLQLTKRVNLIAGSNGAGKSSLRDAIALALTADLGRVSLKKDAPALVTDGADAAHVQVDTENFSSSVSITASGKIVDSLKGVQVPDVLRFVLDAQRFARLEPKDRRAFLFDLMGLKAGGDAVRERLLAKGADKTKVERIVPLLRAGFDAASKEAKEKATQAKGAWRALTGETYGSEKAKTWRAAAPAFDAAKGKDLATKLQHCEAALEQWQQQVGKLQAEQQRRAQLQAKLPALDERAGRLERIETKLEADKKGLAEAEKAVHEAGVAAGQAPRTGLIHELAWAVDNMLLHGDSLDPADPMDARVLASLAAYEREHGKVQRSEPEHDPAAAARLPQLRASRDLMESAVKNSQRDQTAALQARDEAESIRAELAETFDAAGMDEARTKVAELKAERELLVKQADALKALKVQAEGAERKTEEAGKHAADVAAGLGRRRADGRHRHGDGLPERRCAAAAVRRGGARLMDYDTFLRAKVTIAKPKGFEVDQADVNPLLKPHQIAAVIWAIRLGCAALFMAFGLGKTFVQLEIVRIVRARIGGMGLIVIPLGVRQEFIRDAARLGITVKFIRRIEEADDPNGIYLTNYETIRDRKLDPLLFSVASLDEAACLRGFGGSKTFREFMALFAGDDRRDMANRVKSAGVPYRFVATATPSPNEFVELLAYSAFLGVMDVGQAKTRFFKRNSEKADNLTLSPARERDFWLWVASWALFVQKPSDLGYSDDGYELPPIDIRWHEIPADHADAGTNMDGQAQMFKRQAIGVVDAAREKRDSLDARVAKMMELRAEDPAAHRVIWHDLEDERRAIERAIPTAASVYGTQDPETEREPLVVAFSDGLIQELSSKPVLLGSGCNLQRHCAWAIYLGIGFKFADFIQSVHRLQRFLQTRQVRIDLIYTEAEREVRRTLERKWAQHKEQVARMTEIIKEFGLSHAAMIQTLSRAMGVERVEVRAPGGEYVLVNNDCVNETRRMASDSVGLVLTSIPFSTQYEYSPNFADFGHTDSNAHFFQQMDFLVPELLRVLMPGRVAAIHVKNRIVPSGMVEGVGFQTEYPFDVDTIACFRRAGFHFVGRKTIVTDVVRENNQTYRLGYSEQCKDGSRMGFGMCEYLLIFRKAPTDASRGYADVPVVKDKTEYSRPRWQFDAHGYARSKGDRLLTPEELEGLTHADIFKLFRKHSLERVYDFEHDVRIGEALAERGMLPTTFMLLQPQSWHPDVWTDVTRMRTLNSAQSAAGREMHLCPMQFDIADRAITQYSMKGEEVYDPFGGLMTVPYRAVLLGRRGRGCELAKPYFLDGVGYCEQAVRSMSTPSLFDLDELEAA